MDERVKKLWIEALTSGEYEQGQNALRNDGTYCCLGVLCDLHRKEVGGDWVDETDGDNETQFSYDGHDAMLPPSVMRWATLRNPNPSVIQQGKWQYLANLNDESVPFPEIAKLIEANL